jgi:hypothetical protein
LIIASGVLYHMVEPVKLLQDMARASRSIGVWTHYYDADIISKKDGLKKQFDLEPRVERFGSRDVVSYKLSYLDAPDELLAYT